MKLKKHQFSPTLKTQKYNNKKPATLGPIYRKAMTKSYVILAGDLKASCEKKFFTGANIMLQNEYRFNLRANFNLSRVTLGITRYFGSEYLLQSNDKVICYFSWRFEGFMWKKILHRGKHHSSK